MIMMIVIILIMIVIIFIITFVVKKQVAACMQQIVPASQVVPLPSMDPKFLSFILSGLTAAISLDKVSLVGLFLVA